MQRTFVHKEYKIAEHFELAVQSFLEYLCWHGADYRVAMDTIEEYASCAWDSAYYKTHGLRTATIEDVVHESDAAQVWNNSTTAGSFTFREGFKG